MRALVTVSTGVFMILVGCSSASTTVHVTDYDQSCVTAADCVAVHDGSACDTCRCPNALINGRDKARFDSAETSAQQACGGGEICNAACASPQAACVANKCTPCVGASCGSADAGTD